jgi:hypothetical protein
MLKIILAFLVVLVLALTAVLFIGYQKNSVDRVMYDAEVKRLNAASKKQMASSLALRFAAISKHADSSAVAIAKKEAVIAEQEAIIAEKEAEVANGIALHEVRRIENINFKNDLLKYQSDIAQYKKSLSSASPITCSDYAAQFAAEHRKNTPGASIQMLDAQRANGKIDGKEACRFGYAYDSPALAGISTGITSFDITPNGWVPGASIYDDKVPTIWPSGVMRKIFLRVKSSKPNDKKMRVKLFARKNACKDGLVYKPGCRADRLLLDVYVETVDLKSYSFDLQPDEHIYFKLEKQALVSKESYHLYMDTLKMFGTVDGEPLKIKNMKPILSLVDPKVFYKNKLAGDTLRDPWVKRGQMIWGGFYVPF